MTTTSDIARLFRTHYAEMHHTAMLILRDEDAARDIVHDVFESILVGEATDVSGWYLLRAVRNRCLNHIRSLSVKERIKELYAIDKQEIADEEWPDEETIAMIRSAVDKDLTDTSRRVVTMRFTDGMSYREIASAMGVSEVAVYKQLRHAIDVLRIKLSRNG